MPLRVGIECHGRHDDQTDHDLLPIRRHMHDHQAVGKHADQQRADDGASYAAPAAGKACPRRSRPRQ